MPNDERLGFERTVCDCPECSRHCRFMPGMLIPDDVEAIADYLGLSPSEVIVDHLDASPGAKVAKLDPDGRIVTFRIPTLVPRMTPTGCIFLESDGRCRIHPVAPFGCSHCDSHMTDEEGMQRSKAALIAIMESAVYKLTWEALHGFGHIADGPETRREKARKEADHVE